MIGVAVALLAACSSDGSDAADPASSSTPSSTAAPGSTTTEPLVFTGDEGSPFCEQLRSVDPSSLVPGDPTDPTALEAGFRRLVGILRDIQALAPPEIEADAQVVAEGIAGLDAALDAVGYDFDALAASSAAAEVTAAVNDPIFTTAGARLSAYRHQVCRL